MPKLIFNPESKDALVVRLDSQCITVGSAPDNTVAIQGAGLERHHARFERKNDLAYVIDLGSESGTFVDGNRVQRFVLGNRAIVRIGTVDALYLEEETSSHAPVAPEDAIVLQPSNAPIIQRTQQCARCGALMPSNAPICERCGASSIHALDFPRSQEEILIQAEPAPQSHAAGILPVMGFFFSLFGPLVLGIGWLIGIVLGFVSLILLRQREGLPRDRHLAMWAIGLGFLWLALIATSAFFFIEHRREMQHAAYMAQIARANEDAMILLLRDIAIAQAYYKSAGATLLPEGDSAYASLDDLRAIPTPFLSAERLLNQDTGYRITIQQEGAEGFTAIAAPRIHGHTGHKTFSINQTGVLSGADIGDKSPWETGILLPELDGGRSIYPETRERISRELLREARRLAESQDFIRAQFILGELQRNYAMTEAFQKSEPVARGIAQMAMNANAREAAEQAAALLEDGKQTEALSAFKTLLETFPEASNLEKVQSQIAAIETAQATELNNLAQTKLNEAGALEKNGQRDAAIAAYHALLTRHANTDVIKNREASIKAAIARLEEAKARALFAELPNLNIVTNAQQILELTIQLQRECPKTPTATANAGLIQSLRTQAQAQLDAEQGIILLGEGRFLEASLKFDSLSSSNPMLAQQMADSLAECYFQAGNSLFQSNHFAEAATIYEKFLQFTRTPEQLDAEKLKQIYFSLGETHFYNKNYTNAAMYFRKGLRFFGENPKPYRLYGQSLMRQKKFEEALPVYNSLVAISRSDPQSRFERGMCILASMRAAETNIIDNIQNDTASSSAAAIATEARPSNLATLTLPGTIRDAKLKEKEMEMFRDKQFEIRLNDAMEKMKAYAPKTPEAAIIREAIRLVNDIQLSAAELNALSKDATTEMKMKLSRARNQFLAVYTTQQDYFDKIIADKLADKQALLSGISTLKNMTSTASSDMEVASTLENYRGFIEEIRTPLSQKSAMVQEAAHQLTPVIENESKNLEEARSLIRLAISQFKGWNISWNLNERIEKFFFINYNEISSKKNESVKKLVDAINIAIPMEKGLAF